MISFGYRRSASQFKIYADHLSDIKARNKSPEFQVLKDIFLMDEKQIEKHLQNPSTEQYQLVINSFPYWFGKDITHLLLFNTNDKWSKKELETKTLDIIGKQASSLLDKALFDISIYVNPDKYRSVKGLAHSHVFVKQKCDCKTAMEYCINYLIAIQYDGQGNGTYNNFLSWASICRQFDKAVAVIKCSVSGGVGLCWH